MSSISTRRVGWGRTWAAEAELPVERMQLMERGLSVQLAWSSTMYDGQFAGKQPEDITPEEWSVIDAELRRTEETSEADRRS